MSDNVIETTDDGKFRVRVEYMQGCENPRTDGDYHLTGVVTLYAGDYIDVADPAGDERVQDAAERWIDHYGWRDAQRMIERYIRLRGGVSELDTPHDGPVSLWYIVPGPRWSEMMMTDTFDADKAREAMNAERTEYRAWADGETYGYIVEKRVEWLPIVRDPETGRVVLIQPDDDDDDTMETWEEVDSLWGLIGDDYAESEARMALMSAAGIKCNVGGCDYVPTPGTKFCANHQTEA